MLSIGDIVASSWRDAWTTLKTYRTAVYVCLVLAAIGGVVGIFPRWVHRRKGMPTA